VKMYWMCKLDQLMLHNSSRLLLAGCCPAQLQEKTTVAFG